MSKSIKLTDGVYIALDAIRVKKETFSEVVERLIKLYAMMHDVSDILGPSHYLKSEKPPGKVKPLYALGLNEGDDESP